MPYRLEIVAKRAGLSKKSPIWEMFPKLFPITGMYPRFFVVYGCEMEEPITEEQEIVISQDEAVLACVCDTLED